jgi:hypothetical protein
VAPAAAFAAVVQYIPMAPDPSPCKSKLTVGAAAVFTTRERTSNEVVELLVEKGLLEPVAVDPFAPNSPLLLTKFVKQPVWKI